MEEALPQIREISDRCSEANALTVMGASYFLLTEYQKTIDTLTPALPIWESLPDGLRGQAVVLGYIASAHHGLGEWEKVIETYQKELAIYRSLGDSISEGVTLRNLAGFYVRVGDTERALEHANLSLQIKRGPAERVFEAYALNSVGSVYRVSGDIKSAIAAYDRAFALGPLGDKRAEGVLLCNRGSAYFALGDTRTALDYFERSLPLLRVAGERRGEGYALLGIGEIYSSMGQHEKALTHFNEALKIMRAISDRPEEAKSLFYIARSYRDLNQPREALGYIETAIGIIESLRTRIADQQLRAFYSPIVSGYYDLYIDVLMRQQNGEASIENNTAAIEASERGRARSLLDLLNESRIEIRQGVNAYLITRERSVQQSLNLRAEEQVRLVSGKYTAEQAERIAGKIKSLTSQLAEIRAQIRVANPRYATLTQPEPLSLKQIQAEVLDDDTLLLEYALGDKRSYVWAVSKTSITGYELPGRTVIETAARNFYDAIKSNTDYGALARSAGRLSQILLNPVAQHLGTSRLAIVADGALQYVPFSALPAPIQQRSRGEGQDANGQKSPPAGDSPPLILDHEIVSLPSSSALAVLRRETKGRAFAPKVAAVLADPVFDASDLRVKRSDLDPESGRLGAVPGRDAGLKRSVEETGLAGARWPLPRLLGTRREARAILALTPATTSRLAVDFEASRETAIGEDLSQYQIVHFATHSLINSRHPELSGLVLSLVDKRGQPNNGFLRLNEIYNLRLPAELVVLSACQTGLGKEIRGEGLVGLTRGFMYAGARRLMSSLWQVEDASTSELMQRFYRGVLGNQRLSPAAALRAAQIEMWKQKQWRSPYYWAAFVVQGEWK
jgi:CHAT domain-containing protein